MTRTILASATALLAATTLFGSAAEACISCEYVPEVVRGSSTSNEAKPYVKARAYTAEKERRTAPAQKRIVKSEPVAKTVETAKAVPTEAQADNENSSISAVAKVATTETAKVELKAAQSENSSISLASTEVVATEKAPVAETAKQAAAKPTDCKKFFASVGMTLTVPCE